MGLGVVVYEHVALEADPLGEDLLAVRADVAALQLPPVVLQVRLERRLRDLLLALATRHGRRLQGRSLKELELKLNLI